MKLSQRRLSRQEFLMGGVCLLALAALPLIARWRSAAPPAPQQPAVELPKFVRIMALAYSPDGKYVAFGGENPYGLLQVCSWPGAEPQWTASPPPNVSHLTFSPDGLFLLSQEYKIVNIYGMNQQGNAQEIGSAGKVSITLHRTSNGKVIFSVPAPYNAGYISSFCFSPDGKYLISTGARLDVWDWQKGVILKSLTSEVETYSDAAFAADGTLAAPVPTKVRQHDNEEEMQFWDLGTFKIKRRMPLPAGNATRFAFSPDGKLLALIVDKSRPKQHSELQVLNASTGAAVWTEKFQERVSQFAMPADGKFVAAAYKVANSRIGAGPGWTPYQEYVGFWDTNTGKKLAAHPVPNEVHALSLTVDGKTLAYTCDAPTPGTHIYYLQTPASDPAPGARAG